MEGPGSETSLHSLANSGRRRRTLIRLTPLIDVVFILIVFFMLASSFSDWRAIELTTPEGAATGASMEGALLVEVRRDGLRLSGETVSPDTLVSRIEERAALRPDLRVLVKPLPGVPLQDAVRVLDRLTEAGIADMALIGGADD